MTSPAARHPFLGCGLAITLLLVPALVGASDSNAEVRLVEQKIKAGLLYNFLKYVVWPQDAGPTASLCIFGKDPFEGALGPLSSRTVNQRRIVIRRIDTVSATEACELLFVDAAERDRWPQILSVTSRESVLTVADFKGFLSSGGMVEFRREDERIRVRINLPAIAAADLRIEDRLLRLVELSEER